MPMLHICNGRTKNKLLSQSYNEIRNRGLELQVVIRLHTYRMSLYIATVFATSPNGLPRGHCHITRPTPTGSDDGYQGLPPSRDWVVTLIPILTSYSELDHIVCMFAITEVQTDHFSLSRIRSAGLISGNGCFLMGFRRQNCLQKLAE